MKAYADTAFLVSVHSRDANTPRAIARMQSQAFPLAWTWLHQLEFRNAIRLRVFRREILESEAADVFEMVRKRTAEGVYQVTEVSPAAAEEAERLGAIFTRTLGTRSLDILHVSNALALGIKEFLTFDVCQTALAKAAGLKVPKL
ncbi:MAG: PIN domain-containing protein [Verrucomicrobia bacterium]|nr:PIN domain-containing protein [Verrucomicrobiota bacterium]